MNGPPIPRGEPAAFVACRSLGHGWDSIPVPAADRPASSAVVALWLRCERCAMERHDEVSKLSGEVVGRRYLQPDGYHHGRDEGGAASRSDWRWQYLRLIGAVPKRDREYVPDGVDGVDLAAEVAS